MDPPPIGIVRVGLESLEFWEGREVDEENVMDLVKVFEKSRYGCDRYDDHNIIPAYVNPRELNNILELSNLTREELQLSLSSQGFRPWIETGNIKIRGLHGQHRVEAGKRFLPPSESWWTVKLIDRPSVKQGEQFSYETWFSDGEIYRKVRFYQHAQQEDLVQEWMLRLKSKSKLRNLSWLLEREGYTERLDMLLKFPGLWKWFELGNIRRLFALRCDEELQRYLELIFEVWDIITLGDPEIQRSTNIKTVQCLQGRAPFASLADRQSIVRDMNEENLFPNVTNAGTRQRVLEAILGLNVIIPTIKTLNENSKLLEIAVHIIRRELSDSRSGSLFDSLREIWCPPSFCSLEILEGKFRPFLLPNNIEHAYLVYFLTFLSALRQFPNLGNIAPLRDVRSVPLHAQVDLGYKTLFARRARFMGYKNRQIKENCNLISGELALAVRQLPTIKGKEGIETRWGRPFGQAHSQLQRELFIPNLWRARFETTREPSAMYVQQDFLRAFFRPEVFVDWDRYPYLLEPVTTDLTTALRWQEDGHSGMNGGGGRGRRADLLSVTAPLHTGHAGSDFEMQSTISLSSAAISSWVSQLPRSPFIAASVQSSPRVQDLTSRFMNTGIDNNTGIEINTVVETNTDMNMNSNVQVHSPQEPEGITEVNTDVNINLDVDMNSNVQIHNLQVEPEGINTDANIDPDVEMNTNVQIPHTPQAIEREGTTTEATPREETSEQPWEGQSEDSTTILASDKDSWISECSTIVASETNDDQDLASTIKKYHRSYLASHQQNQSYSSVGASRQRSFLNPRSEDQSRKKWLLTRRRGRGQRSFLNPVAKEQRRAPRGRRRMRSLLGLNGDVRSPKGKEILRDPRENGPAFQTSFQNSSDEAIGPRNRGTRAARSFLLAKGRRQNTLQASGNPSQLGNSSRPPNPSERGPVRARSYLRPGGEAKEAHESAAIINFWEHNGMTLLPKSTTMLTDYLKRRKGWVGMIVIDGEPRTLRHDHIAKYMENGVLQNISQDFILVKQAYAEHFRANYTR
ncbi:hypothetical protein L207DRAFT_580988 [Hyaloscypha variabilis F]|uniref:Uncharacterized protein n=1 Tax=Hyaloscypha variabilis (strain UAMH 11265 / GT02V1 / F) TaxID=1149755 RepID=A0A2J6RV40_HYAVF|nr:hypothetical protein L207DRAFT_580988 [Hyaloscypha variabilis F]